MARAVYKYRIDLSGKEKQLLRQAKKKGRKDARLVLRILMILQANGSITRLPIATNGACAPKGDDHAKVALEHGA